MVVEIDALHRTDWVPRHLDGRTRQQPSRFGEVGRVRPVLIEERKLRVIQCRRDDAQSYCDTNDSDEDGISLLE